MTLISYFNNIKDYGLTNSILPFYFPKLIALGNISHNTPCSFDKHTL